MEKNGVEASEELAFSHVKLGTEEEHGKKKKRELSKLEELERATKLEEAKKDPEKARRDNYKEAFLEQLGLRFTMIQNS